MSTGLVHWKKVVQDIGRSIQRILSVEVMNSAERKQKSREARTEDKKTQDREINAKVQKERRATSPLLLLSLLLLSVLLLLIVSLPRPSPPFSVGLRVGIGTVALVVLVLLTTVSYRICWGCVTESNATRIEKRRSKKSIFPCH